MINKYNLLFMPVDNSTTVFRNSECDWYAEHQLEKVLHLHKENKIQGKLVIGLLDGMDKHHCLYYFEHQTDRQLAEYFSVGRHNASDDAQPTEAVRIIEAISDTISITPVFLDSAGFIALINGENDEEKINMVGKMIVESSGGEIYWDYYAEHGEIGTMLAQEGKIHLWWD